MVEIGPLISLIGVVVTVLLLIHAFRGYLKTQSALDVSIENIHNDLLKLHAANNPFMLEMMSGMGRSQFVNEGLEEEMLRDFLYPEPPQLIVQWDGYGYHRNDDEDDWEDGDDDDWDET